jgi:SP family arabinose:H+ symporter-like MFS transporter
MKKPQSYAVSVSVIAAIGGLLFGFDTAVIAGAIRFLKDEFALGSFGEGLAVSIVLVGCMFGAAIAGAASDRIGRKRFLLVSAGLFFVSAVGCALPRDFVQFLVFRFIAGLAIGSASIVSPLYISEIAPARIRGALVSVNQMAIVTGILCAYFVNWILIGAGPSNWRWMFATAALPSVLFFGLVLGVPESPRWLVKQGKDGQALGVLARISSLDVASSEVRSIKETLALEHGSFGELFKPGFRTALLIGIVLAVFQQITGINAVIYYSPRFFESAGLARGTAILQSTVVGLVNMLFTIIAIVLVDRVGRRPLLLIACGGMGVSFILLGAAFKFQLFSGAWVLLFTLLYIAFFAMAMGPIVWVVIAEIFPTRIRGRAMAVATVALWLADFAVSLTFPVIADRLHESFAFWLYAGMCVLDFFFMLFILPETKGRTLEDIERHWLKR